LRLTFGGYNDKLQDFASYVTRKLAREIESVLPDETDFARYKDNIMRGLTAFDVKQPYAHAIYYSGLTLQSRKVQYTNAEMRDAIAKATLPDLTSYVKSLWASGKGEALIQGNLNEKEANEFVKTLDDIIAFRPITAEAYPPRLRALPLPELSAGIKPSKLTIAEPNPSNANSCSQVVIQNLDTSEKDHVLIELIATILEQPLFDELRTKQQLGYIVSSGVKAPDSQTRSLSMIVQSSVAPVQKLTTELLKFLDGFAATCLEPLSEGDVAVYAKGLIDQKTEPDKTLAAEVTRNWSVIANGRVQFDRNQREAAALLDITKADVLEFWKKVYISDGRRLLITEIIPRSGPSSSAAPPKSTSYSNTSNDEAKKKKSSKSNGLELGIDDIEKFRTVREA